MSDEKKSHLCPSSRCEEGARLLGIVQKDGTVAFTPDDLRVDAAFVNMARLGRKPEARFRFAGPCQGNHCMQWTGERCGVVDAVLHEIRAADMTLPSLLPACAIRENCRWFSQAGADACRACPFVITELDDISSQSGQTG
jgi:hypothetical protein